MRRPYSEEEFRKFRDLIQRRTGIYFPDNKREDLMRIVCRKAREAGIEPLRRYYEALLSEKRDLLLDESLTNAVTIGETYFFRYKEQWRLIREHLIPEMIRRKREQKSSQIRIWSAGCSTGEEPYTLAILLRESLIDIRDWKLFIMATDINVASLQVARMAIYGKWSFRSTPEDITRRYFQLIGDKHQVRKDVRDMINFAQLNLVTDDYPAVPRGIHDMDLILCRNVLIYFDPDRIRQVSARMFNTLVPGGVLLTGHSEPTHLMTSQFHLASESGMVFCRRLDTTQRAPRQPAGSRRERAEAGSAPAPVPTDPIGRARELIASGRHDDALSLLHPLAEQGTKHADVYLMIAEIHAGTGRYAEARQWVSRLLELDGLNVDAYRLLSIISEATGQWDDALEYARKGIFLDPESVLTNYQLGCLYQRKGEPEKASKYYRSVLKLLDGVSDDSTLAGGEGLSAGRLRDALKALMR